MCITTRNYWDISNEFKPLMHMWYLGILVQSYVILPLVPMLANRIKHFSCKQFCGICYALITLVSVILYMLPTVSGAAKFYYLPFRLFEISAGAVLACSIDTIGEYISVQRRTLCHALEILLWIAVIALLFIPCVICNRLLLTCLCSCGLLTCCSINRSVGKKCFNVFSNIGKGTLSIYVWHQIILAFIRYVYKTVFSFWDMSLYLLITIIISYLSH